MTVITRQPNSTGSIAAPSTGTITDRFGRSFDYLRIALTQRCNLRCVYCIPEEGLPFIAGENLLTTNEILRLIKVGAALGVTKVRFTGGEPLLRPDLADIIAGTAGTSGVESIHLTTNGILLAEQVSRLQQAGLDGVNISLDTLQPAKFVELARRDCLEQVLGGLHAALAANIPTVKINVVAMRGLNDDEMGAFLALSRELPITVRFIELMPFDVHQIWKTGRFLGVDQMRDRLREEFPGLEATEGSATEELVFRWQDGQGKVALIPAYSRSICGGCTRIRITADGQVRNCLYASREFDLMEILRGGGADEELAAALKTTMLQKPQDGWVAQKQAASSKNGVARQSMTQIGG